MRGQSVCAAVLARAWQAGVAAWGAEAVCAGAGWSWRGFLGCNSSGRCGAGGAWRSRCGSPPGRARGGDFVGGESAEKTKGERDASVSGKNRVAGDEDEAENVVAEVLLVGGVEFGFEICHGGFLLGVEFAAEFFVFALEKFAAAKMVDSAVLGGGHEPGAGIVRDARGGALFQGGGPSGPRRAFGQGRIAEG